MRKSGFPTKDLRFRQGVPDDAVELAALHTSVADHLTSLYGKGLSNKFWFSVGVTSRGC